MKPNIEAIESLVNSKFNGNKAAFAKAIGVKRSQISLLLNHGDSVGAKFYGGLIVYCDCEGLNFRDYIVLPKDVKKINKTA